MYWLTPFLFDICSLNDQPWKGWPTLQAQLVDYSAACEDEVSRSIRVLKTPLQVAHHAPANDLLQELQSFTFACTHAAWGQGHLPIVGVLQYVPKNQSRLVSRSFFQAIICVTISVFMRVP